MGKKLPEKVIDVTGVELTPGEPDICLGNGEQGFECCCDECNYLYICWRKWCIRNKKRTCRKADAPKKYSKIKSKF